MQVGKMDRPIEIQTAPKRKTEMGEPYFDWDDAETYATAWAEKREMGGREFFAAAHVGVEFDTKFFIHFLEGVDTTMRIFCEGKYYDIQFVREIGRRAGLEILGLGRG